MATLKTERQVEGKAKSVRGTHLIRKHGIANSDFFVVAVRGTDIERHENGILIFRISTGRIHGARKPRQKYVRDA